jgi:hypothetical protein
MRKEKDEGWCNCWIQRKIYIYIYIYENKTSGKNMPFPAQNHTVKGVEQNTQMKAGAIVLS